MLSSKHRIMPPLFPEKISWLLLLILPLDSARQITAYIFPYIDRISSVVSKFQTFIKQSSPEETIFLLSFVIARSLIQSPCPIKSGYLPNLVLVRSALSKRTLSRSESVRSTFCKLAPVKSVC